MKRTKLVRIFASLDKTERKAFKDFVCSPYYNKNPRVTALCGFLLTFDEKNKAEVPKEAAAYSYVFGNATFQEDAITKLSSKLQKLLEQFIVAERSAMDDISNQLQLLNFFGEKDLIHDYNLYLQRVQKWIEQDTMRDSQYFYRKFLIEQELSKAFRSKREMSTIEHNLKSAISALDKYYLILKLSYLYHQYAQKNVDPNASINTELMQEIETYLPHSAYLEIPAIKIWFTALQLLKQGDKATNYQTLKTLIFSYYEQLNSFDIKNILGALQNHARLVFSDKEAYYQEWFEINNFQLERGILDNPMFLTPTYFLNVVNVAVLLDKLLWADKFLSDRMDYDQNRDDAVHCLGSAIVAFAQRDFDRAQDLLIECKLKNIYFKMVERRLWVKVYIEQNLPDQIEYQVNSFRKFLSIHKDQIVDLHLQANRNFISFIFRFNNLIKTDQEQIQMLHQEVKTTSAAMLPEKRWLLEKLSSLIK